MNYVYIETDRGPDGETLYTVGFYDPTGKWHEESDWPTKEEAADQVHFLNGGD